MSPTSASTVTLPSPSSSSDSSSESSETSDPASAPVAAVSPPYEKPTAPNDPKPARSEESVPAERGRCWQQHF